MSSDRVEQGMPAFILKVSLQCEAEQRSKPVGTCVVIHWREWSKEGMVYWICHWHANNENRRVLCSAKLVNVLKIQLYSLEEGRVLAVCEGSPSARSKSD